MFDPNLHQSMAEIEDNNFKPGDVVQEIQPGYMLGERLLRPALLRWLRKKMTKMQKKRKIDKTTL